MKFFKKREKPNNEYRDAFTKDEQLNYSKPDLNETKREELLEEYHSLEESYKLEQSEKTRLRMVEISEILSEKQKEKEKKPSKLFGKKEKFEDVYCYTCQHNINLHHRNGRSTGCRKCGCLRTKEEILNPTDNGHDKDFTIPLDNPVIEEPEKIEEIKEVKEEKKRTSAI